MADEQSNPLPDEGVELEGVTNEVEEFDSTEVDEDGNPIEGPAAEIEEIEVERDGKTFKIPKALEAELLMQADYTRKTQEIAAERKALEQSIQEFEQATEQELVAKADMLDLGREIAKYSNVDWATWHAQNPAEAQQHWMHLGLLKDQRGQAETTYRTAKEQRDLATQQHVAKQNEQAAAEIRRAIPDWGPEKALELTGFAKNTYGFTDEDIGEISDIRVIRALNDAAEAVRSRSSNKATQKVQQQQAIRPAATVKAGASPRRGLDDRASTDAWMRERNAQANKPR